MYMYQSKISDQDQSQITTDLPDLTAINSLMMHLHVCDLSKLVFILNVSLQSSCMLYLVPKEVWLQLRQEFIISNQQCIS